MSDAQWLTVVGAGVGRTGTLSLKFALERLLGAPCHHMIEVWTNPDQMPWWTDAIEGRPVDWAARLARYRAVVDFPGCCFWRELREANPDALVLLSVRPAEDWYRSASRTIFTTFDDDDPAARPWLDSIRRLFRDRFSDRLDDPAAMIGAYERHNDAVRREVPPDRLLEWRPEAGWGPICDRLGMAVPDEPFPRTNSTNDFLTRLGRDPVE